MAATADFANTITQRMRRVTAQADRTSGLLGSMAKTPMPYSEAAFAALEAVKVLAMMTARPEAEGGARKPEVRESAARILAHVEATRIPAQPDNAFIVRMLNLVTEMRTLFVNNVRWQDGSNEEESDRTARIVIAELRRALNNAKVQL